MSQLDFDGNEQDSLREIVLRAINKMEKDGLYNDQAVARHLVKEKMLPDWWTDGRLLISTTQLVSDVSTRRNSAGISPALKLEKPHQYRLRNWCSFDEKLSNLSAKLVLYQHDGHAIRIDASAIMREHPERKNEVLDILPPELRPSEK